jgi:hypothetical protein
MMMKPDGVLRAGRMRWMTVPVLAFLLVAALAAAAPASAPGPAPASASATAPAASVANGASSTAGGAAGSPARSIMVDDFEDLSAWKSQPADGVELAIRPDAGVHGRSMRLDFRFAAGSGWAVAHKAFDLELPENYAFTFRLRGAAPTNHLEFKLIDATGENVWWFVRRDLRFPEAWEVFTTRKRQISFAWGPAGGGEIRRVAAIEFAITAGSGGSGSVWIDDLELRPLPPPTAAPPAPVASSSSSEADHRAALATDGDAATAWVSAPGDTAPWILLDLHGPREFGGLILDWAPGKHPDRYRVEESLDGVEWRTIRTVAEGNGGRDYLCLPESEAAFLRVRTGEVGGGEQQAGGQRSGVQRPGTMREGVSLREITVEPLAWSSSREAFFQAVARDVPRGSYPRGITGEEPSWTVVGVDGDAREVLFGEDGNIETGKASWSVEPFLFADGRLLTWADVSSRQSLEEGSLPIPTVEWTAGSLGLTITPFAIGPPGASSVVVRYRVYNRGAERKPVTLYLAMRPFQVNPPAQFLNTVGGCAPVRRVSRDSRRVRVDGAPGLVSLAEPAAFGATAFDGGDLVNDFLRNGRLPPDSTAADSFAAASGALSFPLDLGSGEEAEVAIVVPLYAGSNLPPEMPSADARAWTAARLAECRTQWKSMTGAVSIELPGAAADIGNTLRAQLGYVLVNRAGPAIQPGTRSYARSWIRDGALTSSALLRLGRAGTVRAFIQWFAPNQFPSGKIPCVVDARGPDPVPEHDSSGEFIFLVAEYYRFTGDRAFAESLLPRVEKAASYLDSLRQERRSEAWRTPETRPFFGLLPPSISHEGYSAKPMHSYWDDAWALRGFRDAAFLAGELGSAAERARWQAAADEFGRDFAASVAATQQVHGIDYVPGCADLGDFDATSTTILLAPTGAASVLPRASVERTFERYWDFFRDRRAGEPWEAFTPYELRNVGAFVRLGWRGRAHELLAFFLAHRNPEGWRQWAEVVWREPRVPRFIGDLPHTWVGTDFVRSVLDMLAYDEEPDSTLVIGAGVPRDWVKTSPGLAVRGLRTPHGALSYTMRMAGGRGKDGANGRTGGAVEVRIEGGLRVPRGGVVVRTFLDDAIREATVNGKRVTPGAGGGVVVRELPATVVVRGR